MRALAIEMLVVALARAAASAGGLARARIRRRVCGVGVGIRARGRGLVEAEFLLFVVRFVANAGAPRLVGVQSAAGAAAARLCAVAGFLVRAGGGAVVAVLELADLGVDEAFDACGRGAWVVGGAAVRRLAEGLERVHRRRREAVALGIPAGVKVPAEV